MVTDKTDLKLASLLFLFGVSIIITFLIVDTIFYSSKTKDIALDNAINKIEERETVFKNFIEKAGNTLYSIRESKLFNDYLDNNLSSSIQITDLFRTITKSNKSFMQLRYLDSKGFERIRIDRSINGDINTIKNTNLQNKSNRYYFADSRLKPLEKVWFSKLDLNMEKGVIEKPFKPTLRAILPIKYKNRFGGILIINYYMKEFLNRFSNISFYNMILAEKSGYTIIHSDSNKNWGEYSKYRYNISDDFPKNYKTIISNNFVKKHDFISKKLDLPIANELYLILKFNQKYIDQIKLDKIYEYLLVSFIVMILTLIAILLISIILKRLHIKLSNTKKTNDELRLFKHIIENASTGITISKATNKDDELTYVNKTFEKLTGYTKDEAIGKNCRFLQGDDTDQEGISIIKKALEDKTDCQVELRNYKKDGQMFYNLISISPIPDDNNNITHFVGAQQDITQYKEQELLLQQQQRLASMGDMMINIAHQWRQPLSVISTAATGLKIRKEHDMLTDEDIYNTCDAIDESAQYLSSTINDFSTYMKGDESKPVRFDLKNDTDSFLKLVDSTIKRYNIKIILELEEHIKVEGYPNELIQCFINIFNNAKDALLQNHENNRYIFITQRVTDHTITIKFKDNAGGIPEDIIPKIFEPYFTTKHKSQGTGLGLNMTYNIIVNAMKGTLKVNNVSYEFNSIKMKGAEFTITLPLS